MTSVKPGYVYGQKDVQLQSTTNASYDKNGTKEATNPGLEERIKKLEMSVNQEEVFGFRSPRRYELELLKTQQTKLSPQQNNKVSLRESEKSIFDIKSKEPSIFDKAAGPKELNDPFKL